MGLLIYLFLRMSSLRKCSASRVFFSPVAFLLETFLLEILYSPCLWLFVRQLLRENNFKNEQLKVLLQLG